MSNRPISERIAHYRELAKLTSEEMAEMLGMSVETYNKKEQNIDIDFLFLNNVATILNIEVKYLLIDSVREEPLIFKRNPPMLVTHSEGNLIEILRRIPTETKEKILNLVIKVYENRNISFEDIF